MGLDQQQGIRRKLLFLCLFIVCFFAGCTNAEVDQNTINIVPVQLPIEDEPYFNHFSPDFFEAVEIDLNGNMDAEITYKIEKWANGSHEADYGSVYSTSEVVTRQEKSILIFSFDSFTFSDPSLYRIQLTLGSSKSTMYVNQAEGMMMRNFHAIQEPVELQKGDKKQIMVFRASSESTMRTPDLGNPASIQGEEVYFLTVHWHDETDLTSEQ